MRLLRLKETAACAWVSNLVLDRLSTLSIIENLCGRRFPLRDAELDALSRAQKDFSVLEKTFCCLASLLAGPSRLLNHSCQPNAELRVMGERFEVTVAASEQIVEGEEITIDYGGEYFGSGNAGCLCVPCSRVGEVAAVSILGS